MTSPTISVIVPVYNGEPYLAQCLESILAQDYRNFELILVNDGSTDSSGEICKCYAELDPRIILITQLNAGASSARNAGIKAATGKYIVFVDSDDWVDPDYLSILLNNMTENGLSVCSISINQMRNDGKFCIAMSAEEAQISIFSASGMQGYSCGKMYDRNMIESKNISFDVDITFCEDLLFAVKSVSFVTGSIFYDGRKPYHYRQGHLGVTFQRFTKEQLFDKRKLSEIEAIRRCFKYLLPGDGVTEAYNVRYLLAEENILRVMAANDYQNPELYRQLHQDVIKGWLRCLRSPYCSLRNKLAICLSVISPKLSLLAWRLTHKVK